MGTRESYSDDNTNDEIENTLQQTTTPSNYRAWMQGHLKEGIQNILALAKMLQVANSLAIISCVDTSRGGNVSDNLEKKKKGLLASIYTTAQCLSGICGSIFLLLANFIAQKEKENFKDTWPVQVIFIGSFFALLSSMIIFARAAYLEKSELIDGFDLGIFKWMLLHVLVYLYATFCILLGAFDNTQNWVLWTLGIIGSCSIVIVWVWFFYIKWPKIMEKINAGRIGEDLRSTERPDPTQLV